MKKIIKENFYFFDGYNIDKDLLENTNLISDLLNEINLKYLNNKGKCVLIPCVNNTKKSKKGISGIVIGNNFHFTCHSFSDDNVIYVDMYNKNKIKEESFYNILTNYFETQKYDICKDNEEAGNFGKHIIIKNKVILYEDALILIDKIIKKINMTPLFDKITNEFKNGYDIIRPIKESHISIHSNNKETIIDIFSCNGFDEDKVFDELKNIIDAVKIERGVYLK